MRRSDIRNIVIVAHVDHGKTTLVDCLLRQSGHFRETELKGEQILDTNDLERERGITILAKNIALSYQGIKINIIDTPGHADFGGEVERVIRMADGALILVDAAEGPMPQTRFVVSKALDAGLKPIVVVNKVDRSDARAYEVLDEAFELLMELGADHQMDDFPFVFCSAKQGFATLDLDLDQTTTTMKPLLDLIVNEIPGPEVEQEGPFQMLVTTLDWSEYVGRIAIGRIQSGAVNQLQQVALLQDREQVKGHKVSELYTFDKLGRTRVDQATAGDVVAVVGLEDVEIGDTICDPGKPRPLPRLTVDEPTLEMIFSINSSPFSGRDGKYVTTRQIRQRLLKELERNVALNLRFPDGSDSFAVSGRGILHLSILIETMRREGFELSIGKPRVIVREKDGRKQEPFEILNVEIPTERLGPVMEMVGECRGSLVEMQTRESHSLAVFSIPARGLIGLRTRLLNATQGTVILHHRFAEYQSVEGDIPGRGNGVMVSTSTGRAVAFALGGLQQRADMFVAPGDEVYEGMIVGENSRENDLCVNPTKEKKLTNMRASGSDDNVILKPPRRLSLEAALEYVEEDELVEVTPQQIRLRKILLKESDRRRQTRQGSKGLGF
ncbi:MAG: translational GTPase TypA [Planctomycetota bacterium]|nr:translational GTPase TypA [Planctomycetota bacterium]